MNDVVVIMSTYNGEKYVKDQILSIINQKHVNVTLYIRDDGSKDNTPLILKSFQDRYENIIVSLENNIGWKKSFLKALRDSPDSKYYAFSDQDDIWFEDKLIKCIEKIRNCPNPALCHCNKIKVDQNLHKINNQQKKICKPNSLQQAILNSYAQGASSVFNKQLKTMICSFEPSIDVGHDYWLGLLAYLFGSVYFINIPLFYHRIHGNNVSDTGNIIINRIRNFYRSCKKGFFPNPSYDLICNFKSEMSYDQLKFITLICNYKKETQMMKLLLRDKQFRPNQVMWKPVFLFRLLTRTY